MKRREFLQGLGLAPFLTGWIHGVGGIIPANRLTQWRPGVTYNGGIPNRTTIFTTLSPAGAGLDDTTAINNAIAAAPDNTVVAFTAGTFNVNGNGLICGRSNITLRGVGPGTGGLFGTIDSTGLYVCTFNPQGTGTFFNKQDRVTNHNFQILLVSPVGVSSHYQASANLVADAVKGSMSCRIDSNPGLVIGNLVTVDINTDNHPDVFWGERNNPPGSNFIANSTGTTSLTVSAIDNPFDLALGNPKFLEPMAGVPSNTFITGQVSGTPSGNGVYTTSAATTLPGVAAFAGNGFRRNFCRQDRSLSQILRILSFANNGDGTFTVNFETPFHITFPVAFQAMLVTFPTAPIQSVGIEGIYFFGGMGGDFHGNIVIDQGSSCWIKNCESHFCEGSGVDLVECYRCEVRDSYMHETDNPDPGGSGYLFSLNNACSDCLVENNIMINGNKCIVMRCTGGGNVVAYNYMDDAFGAGFPFAPEAGVNAGHFTTPHMELLEGNYSHQYTGDSFWGGSIYITVHRNWLTGTRAAHPPLNTYAFISAGCTYLYGDYVGRVMANVQAGSYYTSFTGNVLGTNGQVLNGYDSHSCFDSNELAFQYENLDNFLPTNTVPMWQMGTDQSHQGVDGNAVWVPSTYQTQLRQGNFDWFSGTQKWHGIGGSDLHGGNPPPPRPLIPNSFYLSSTPPFFGVNPWPWVNPTTGATTTLPAKARFDAGTPNA